MKVVGSILRGVRNFLLALSLALLCLLMLARFATAGMKTSVEGQDWLCEAHVHPDVLGVEYTRGWPTWDRLGLTKSPDPTTWQFKEVWGVRVMTSKPLFWQIYSPAAQELGVVSGGGSWVSANAPVSAARQKIQTTGVFVKWWMVFAAAGLPWIIYMPVAAWRGLKWVRARRRFAAGCCQNCGYDMRATPERCPECGKSAVHPT